MKAPPLSSLSLIFIALSVNACCSTLPHETNDKPEFLVENFVHTAKNECWRKSHTLLSTRTRQEYGALRWSAGASKLAFPGSEVKAHEIIARGETLAITPYDDEKNPTEYLWILQDKISKASEGKSALFNILLVKDEEDKKSWRVGLQEHADRGLSPFAD